MLFRSVRFNPSVIFTLSTLCLPCFFGRPEHALSYLPPLSPAYPEFFNQKNNSMKKSILVCLLAACWLACNKDEIIPIADYDNYNQVIEAGGPVADPPPASSEVLDETLADEEQNNELWRCTTSRYKVGYHSGGQNGFPQFNPNASVIYPGSLLQAKSLHKATPDIIAVERAGGTISIDILDGSAVSSFEVEKVTKSSITNASNADRKSVV